jgi:hypothetical protein
VSELQRGLFRRSNIKINVSAHVTRRIEMTKVEKIIGAAQDIADERPNFFMKKGAGEGDKDTNSFMTELRSRAKQKCGVDFSEKQICGENNQVLLP